MLENMSLSELWDLFPITFVDGDEVFEIQYLEETTNKQLTLITCTEHNQKRLIIICQINGEKNKMIS